MKKAARKVAMPIKRLPHSSKVSAPLPPPPSFIGSTFASIDDLYHAYRKAKVDVFFERTQPLALAFCEYETNLHANLMNLQARLTQSNPEWFNDLSFIGDYGFIPKGLQIPKSSDDQSNVAHFSVSSPDDAWNVLLHDLGEQKPIAEFRPVALFTVNMYVVCALWVNLVGHMFDSCLDRTAKGSRLRRLKNRSGNDSSSTYHLTAPGSFQPYFQCYKEWRENGLRAIRQELTEDRRVVAITMDLKSFYHNIDPQFLLRTEFLDAIRFVSKNGRGLEHWETTFTNQLIVAFLNWGSALPNRNECDPPGLPVGPSAPRVIANVLLAEFDRLVQEALDPIYYSRYVDDIFLVLRDHGTFRSSNDVLNHLVQRIEPLNPSEDFSELTLSFRYSTGSKLSFQTKKQRVFLLAGVIGTDLLDTIESQIDAVSSEWRLLPDLDVLERSPAARVLTASVRANENADTLRKADQLSLKRLSFSIMLSQYDTLAHDLPPQEWKQERTAFYKFAERHVLTALRILDLYDYLPRLVGLAVSCSDWKSAHSMIKRIIDAFSRLKSSVFVGPDFNPDKQWAGFMNHLQASLREAIVRSCPLDPNIEESFIQRLLEEVNEIEFWHQESIDGVQQLSRNLFWTDLGRYPFKFALLGYRDLPQCPLGSWECVLPDDQEMRSSVIREFLSGTGNDGIHLRPLLFPTRPFTPREVTECDCTTASDVERLRKYVVALRGTWVKPAGPQAEQTESQIESESFETTSSKVVVIGEGSRRHLPRIAVTSFLSEESSWSEAARGTPDLSVDRYKRLVRLANAIVTSPHRADYVVFPELSIPRRWLPGLAGVFMKAGMSLIAGVEYRRNPKNPNTEVISEAFLILTDDRLGYPSWCVVRQQKGVPAHHERDWLRSRFGLTLAAPEATGNSKPIYRHFKHDFGVLICSELTDMRFRQQFRGNIDTLFVLSWNQDLESFSALVDASVLDIHCYLALINNSKYGDSRVRTPSKITYKRDQVRIKGGLDDYFVVTDLDIASLRDFQSYHECPLGDNARFKPTPEGFVIADRRRQTPGGKQ